MIEANYQGLTGISQAYLSEQRGKLDMILDGCLHRLIALQRYQTHAGRAAARPTSSARSPASKHELARARAARARARGAREEPRAQAPAARVAGARSTTPCRTLQTELDSMESLLEVLHQNSISLRDPQAIAEELDTIVRQSEDSERVVREMEALLRTDTDGWQGELGAGGGGAADAGREPSDAPGAARQKVKGR